MPRAAPKHRPMRALAPRHKPRGVSRQASRVLPTNSAAWRYLREQILVRDCYTCADCGRIAGKKGEAHVDHVDGNAMNNDPANLATRCRPCHSIKTAKRDGGFGNRRG